MPRYFFHVTDGYSPRDTEGIELPDIYTAQHQAIRTSGELLRDMGGEFWNSSEWKLEVTDEQGQILLTLRFLAEEHPALTDPSSDQSSA
jgi:hypothetical protein